MSHLPQMCTRPACLGFLRESRSGGRCFRELWVTDSDSLYVSHLEFIEYPESEMCLSPNPGGFQPLFPQILLSGNPTLTFQLLWLPPTLSSGPLKPVRLWLFGLDFSWPTWQSLGPACKQNPINTGSPPGAIPVF